MLVESYTNLKKPPNCDFRSIFLRVDMSNRSGELCSQCYTDSYKNSIIYRRTSTKHTRTSCNTTSKYSGTSTFPVGKRTTKTSRFHNGSDIQDEDCQHGEIDRSETSKDSKQDLFAPAPRLHGEVCPHSCQQCPNFSTQHYAQHVSLSLMIIQLHAEKLFLNFINLNQI